MFTTIREELSMILLTCLMLFFYITKIRGGGGIQCKITHDDTKVKAQRYYNLCVCLRALCPVFLMLFTTSEVFASHLNKIEFWNQQRKGTNFFNKEPDEKWFKDAHELGIDWARLTFVKWQGKDRDFLIGNSDNYHSLVLSDLEKLKLVLSWAYKYNIKIVLTAVSLPGSRWVQGTQKDTRLWQDKKYWQQSEKFWHDIAIVLKDHPAVYAYNIVNEPIPEKGTGLSEQASVTEYKDWYKKYKDSSHDIVDFYRLVIESIRKVDAEIPIMLDSGWYARPDAFTFWPRIDDDKILYAFHMYEPFNYTNRLNFHQKLHLTYPGSVPYAGDVITLNKQWLSAYTSNFFVWAAKNNIPNNRLVASEFGCYRRDSGCKEYLKDLMDGFNQKHIHWAFYSFREDEWDGYDYEVGTKGLSWTYWKAKDKGLNPTVPRKDNPLFDVIKSEFR